MVSTKIRNKRRRNNNGSNNGKAGSLNATLPGDGHTEAQTVAIMRLQCMFKMPRIKVDVIIPSFATIAANTVTPTFGGLSFQIADVFAAQPAYADLFDQYRILAVDCLFKPTSSVSSYPDFITAIDYDNSPAVSTAGAISVYSTAVACSSNQFVRRRFKPRAAITYFNTAVTSGYGLQDYGAWMDCAYPRTPHYGLIYWVGVVLNTNYNITVDVKYTVEFGSTV